MDRPLLGVRRSRLPITMAMIMSHGAWWVACFWVRKKCQWNDFISFA
uniref:Uncharacterized protein n=1 Tax=Anguilla anguilla TaxID=7936 RepID=A0A0E9VSX7_ANGAN